MVLPNIMPHSFSSENLVQGLAALTIPSRIAAAQGWFRALVRTRSTRADGYKALVCFMGSLPPSAAARQQAADRHVQALGNTFVVTRK